MNVIRMEVNVRIKRNSKRLIAGSIACIMLLLNFNYAYPVSALAQETPNEVSEAKAINLNCISKKLKLGYEGVNTYDFDVEGSSQLPGATYSWYVKADKGNPDAVTINKRTGLVTAKKAGIAYIRCKVTLEDGTILRPEAKVTVFNDITGVIINNLPKSMTIKAGYPTNFNRTITNTKAGKGIVTRGITRWEISDDTAGVNEADDSGVVFPTNEGEFSIRAVCFQNKSQYRLWKANKEKYDDNVTAASQWHTIKVVLSDNKALVTTNEQLRKALASDSLEIITLLADKNNSFEIEKGDYSSKTLVVDAPNTEINLETNGIIGNIRIPNPSKINLTGSTSVIPVTVEEAAGSSLISTSAILAINLHANADITFIHGSEGSTIDKSESNIEVKVDNKSNNYIAITTNKTKTEMVPALSTGISNEDTTPYQTTYQPSDMKATSISLVPNNMVLSITGSALSMFVAVTTPEYTTDTISWITDDESVAIIDEYGVVTPTGLGTTLVIASTGNVTSVAQVKVVSGPAIHIENSESTNLQSAALFIAAGLANGALEKVGSDLMGWGLKEAGLDFASTTDDEIKAMSEKLDEISTQISDLKKQLADSVQEITLEIKRNEINTRIGQMNVLIGNIESIGDNLDFLITSKTLSPRGREQKTREIIYQIEKNLLSQENQIHNQLVGAGTQTSLIKVYSEAIKLSNNFLDTKDTEKVRDMYEYFANIQINMLILMVEYYHAVYDDPNDAKLEIDHLIKIFMENIKEQEAILKPIMPTDYIFDRSNKIMIYTGYISYKVNPFKSSRKIELGPLRASIFMKLLGGISMSYNYGYNNWRLLAIDEITLWHDKSQGGLYNYLVSSGWDTPNMNRKYEIGIEVEFFSESAPAYLGYSVDSGARDTEIIPLLYPSRKYNYSVHTKEDSRLVEGIGDISFYWILCRSYSNELSQYFY